MCLCSALTLTSLCGEHFKRVVAQVWSFARILKEFIKHIPVEEVIQHSRGPAHTAMSATRTGGQG
jgi:hypothetical protein